MESSTYYYSYLFKELHKLEISEHNGQCSLSFKKFWIQQLLANKKHHHTPCHNSTNCHSMHQGENGEWNTQIKEKV
jgi:hypothetical protein